MPDFPTIGMSAPKGCDLLRTPWDKLSLLLRRLCTFDRTGRYSHCLRAFSSVEVFEAWEERIVMTFFTKRVVEELRAREAELSSARTPSIQVQSCQEMRSRICKKTTIKRDEDKKRVPATV